MMRHWHIPIWGALLATPSVTAVHEPQGAEVPSRRIGPWVDSTEYHWSSVAAVIELESGALLVLDRREQRVSRARFGANDLRAVGGRGGGPTEYRQPWELLRYRGDSVLIWDLTTRRFIVASPTGEAVRSFGMPPNAGPIAPRGSDAVGTIYFEPQSAPGRDSVPVVRWNPSTDRFDTLVSVDGSDIVTRHPEQEGRRVTLNLTWPFGVRDEWRPLANGDIAIVRADPYRVERWRGAQRVHLSPRIPLVPARFTREEREFNASGSTPSPEFKPPFVDGSLRVVTDSLLLLEEHVADGDDRTYVVIARDAPALRLRLGGERRVVGASRRWLYVAEANSDGLLRLLRAPMPLFGSRRG